MRKKCIICEGEIYRGKIGVRKKTKRKTNSLTCSPKCSEIYSRILRYISTRQRYKIIGKQKLSENIKSKGGKNNGKNNRKECY